jgi:hypothetical protein
VLQTKCLMAHPATRAANHLQCRKRLDLP